MKTSPETSPLNPSIIFPFLKERIRLPLCWLLPMLLALSPLARAQMLHPGVMDHRYEGEHRSRETSMAWTNFSDLPVASLASNEAWTPFYRWSGGALSMTETKGEPMQLAAQEVPEPSIGAVLLGGVALLIGFNFLRRRRLLIS